MSRFLFCVESLTAGRSGELRVVRHGEPKPPPLGAGAWGGFGSGGGGDQRLQLARFSSI